MVRGLPERSFGTIGKIGGDVRVDLAKSDIIIGNIGDGSLSVADESAFTEGTLAQTGFDPLQSFGTGLERFADDPLALLAAMELDGTEGVHDSVNAGSFGRGTNSTRSNVETWQALMDRPDPNYVPPPPEPKGTIHIVHSDEVPYPAPQDKYPPAVSVSTREAENKWSLRFRRAGAFVLRFLGFHEQAAKMYASLGDLYATWSDGARWYVYSNVAKGSRGKELDLGSIRRVPGYESNAGKFRARRYYEVAIGMSLGIIDTDVFGIRDYSTAYRAELYARYAATFEGVFDPNEKSEDHASAARNFETAAELYRKVRNSGKALEMELRRAAALERDGKIDEAAKIYGDLMFESQRIDGGRSYLEVLLGLCRCKPPSEAFLYAEEVFLANRRISDMGLVRDEPYEVLSDSAIKVLKDLQTRLEASKNFEEAGALAERFAEYYIRTRQIHLAVVAHLDASRFYTSAGNNFSAGVQKIEAAEVALEHGLFSKEVDPAELILTGFTKAALSNRNDAIQAASYVNRVATHLEARGEMYEAAKVRITLATGFERLGYHAEALKEFHEAVRLINVELEGYKNPQTGAYEGREAIFFLDRLGVAYEGVYRTLENGAPAMEGITPETVLELAEAARGTAKALASGGGEKLNLVLSGIADNFLSFDHYLNLVSSMLGTDTNTVLIRTAKADDTFREWLAAEGVVLTKAEWELLVQLSKRRTHEPPSADNRQ